MDVTILYIDRIRSIEQKVACVLIQRMSKCYPMKSILFLNVLHFINIWEGLLYNRQWAVIGLRWRTKSVEEVRRNRR